MDHQYGHWETIDANVNTFFLMKVIVFFSSEKKSTDVVDAIVRLSYFYKHESCAEEWVK